MTRRVVDLAEELVAGVLEHAEAFAGASAVAADSGAVESLRWAGALPVLVRDLGVPRILGLPALWDAVDQGPRALRALLAPALGGGECDLALEEAEDAEPEADDEDPAAAVVPHLVLLVTGFLWDYDRPIRRLLGLGLVRRLTVCSGLSERAHECYDFGPRPPQPMVFADTAAAWSAASTCPPTDQHSPPPPAIKKSMTTATPESGGDRGDEADDDDWGWTDDAGAPPEAEDEDGDGESEQRTSPDALDPALTPSVLTPPGVAIRHLPLHYAPLLASRHPSQRAEPSLFVLSHPLCATAFPLLLTHVLRGLPPTPGPPPPAYAHVKDVQPEHIPREFRRTLKLVAHALAEVLVHARLDVGRERLFALGATSLKIGHTLLRILRDLQEELTTQTLQGHEPAAVVLVDRTCDLASPCGFGVSLLDRVLALLPQTPDAGAPVSLRPNRKSLHVTEIFPIHGCEPTPLAVAPVPVDPADVGSFASSPFVGPIPWKAGGSLCHASPVHGAGAFRALAFRPAKLALRDLDRRLQEVEHELVQANRIPHHRSGSIRRPTGEKKASTRGRDVVLRRLVNVLGAGEPTKLEHCALVELGIIVLETLERMERVQQRWDQCRERVARHNELGGKGAGEWIIPELTDTVQRELVAARARSSGVRAVAGGDATSSSIPSLEELLLLLVHAFALSSGSPIEDYTLQMIRNVVSECFLESAIADGADVARLFPDIAADVLPFVARERHRREAAATQGQRGNGGGGGDDDDEDWGWGDDAASPRGQSPRRRGATSKATPEDDEYARLQAKAVVEAHLERVLAPLKECAQLFVRPPPTTDAQTSTPSSLLFHLVRELTSPAPAGVSKHLEQVVDASEQLTRAGIDLLKSGFSRFGFGGAGGGGGSGGGGPSRSVLGDAQTLVVFVIGGVTFEEVQDVYAALEGRDEIQVLVGSTTLTNGGIVVEQLFK